VTSGHGWESGIRVDGGASGPDEPQVVVRDRRRIDPESGEVRTAPAEGETAAATPSAAGSAAAEAVAGEAARAPSAAREPTAARVSEAAASDQARSDTASSADTETELVTAMRAQVAERTADLQRLKAEYDNYRRRVERDRQLVADQAVGRLLGSLLPTLDDIGRARDHGDLEGPFKTVAEALETTLESAGLERFGSVGEPFDPLVHDALMHSYRSDVAEPTCVEVYRAGYRYAGRVLRAAQVVVAEPPPAASEPAEPAAASPAQAPEGDLPTAAGWEPAEGTGGTGTASSDASDSAGTDDGSTVQVD
jgi:molecular chaperone GrpE